MIPPAVDVISTSAARRSSASLSRPSRTGWPAWRASSITVRRVTPASGTLQGITRRSLIELARQAGQPVEEGRLTAGDLGRAAEILVTSTAGGIMPVTVIDGQPVGAGMPGPLTLQLRDLYWASHEDPRYCTPVRYDEPG